MSRGFLSRMGLSVGALITASLAVTLMLWSAYAYLDMVWLVEPFHAVIRTFVHMFWWGVV